MDFSLEIDKENETIKATVSIKAAQPNIMRENMQKYRKDGIYLGKISGARNGGYFVQIGNHVDGIDVYCKKHQLNYINYFYHEEIRKA